MVIGVNQKRGLYYLVACLAIIILIPLKTAALQSSNYRFDETTVGAGGLIPSSSSSYISENGVSDLVIGNTASSNYQIDTGSKTTNDPALSFAVNGSGVSFGSFSSTGTSTAEATFTVSNYTSYGYAVQIMGTTPSNGSHIIPAMTTTAGSTIGIEQFGINLVANTAPTTFGANPNNGQFGFGVASANYSTPNQFRFVSGETIASAPKNSGLTTYTISYIINVESLTPGGQYSGDQTILIVGTY